MSLLNFIGRGSCLNRKEGNNSAYILKDDGLLLFDCGPLTTAALIEQKFFKGLSNICVVITHTHPDHFCGLPDLILYSYYRMSIPVKIIFPDPERMTFLLHELGIREGFYMEEPFIRNGEKLYLVDPILLGKPVYLKPFKTQHYDDMFNSYGYLITFGTDTVYYSGDAKTVPDEIVRQFGRGSCLILYQDVSFSTDPTNPHMHIGDLAALIKDWDRFRVYCMHLDEAISVSYIQELGFQVVEVVSGGIND